MTKPTHSQPPMANHTIVSIPELRAVLNGRVISPEDAAYDTVRAVFYGARSRRPALIVRVADATDVSHVVSLAREGTGAGRPQRRPQPRRSQHHRRRDRDRPLRHEGTRDRRCQAHRVGRDRPDCGRIHGCGGRPRPRDGIRGHRLCGDRGDHARRRGQVPGAQVRSHHRRSPRRRDCDRRRRTPLRGLRYASRPHLGIRGGGGNFGVATRFKFRLHEVDTIVGGMLILPATPEVIASFVAEAEAAPEELSTIANVMVAPPMPFLPAEAHGRLVIMALLCYAGEVDEGERALAPFRGLAEPIADMVKPMPYPEIYPPEEEDYHPIGSARTMFIDTIDRSVAE